MIAASTANSSRLFSIDRFIFASLMFVQPVIRYDDVSKQFYERSCERSLGLGFSFDSFSADAGV
jgi:hypothetical protein